ncbi:MAG TPA: type IV pilus biogenesis/stability protein PilW [Xanthomonadaceae bacterium]|nr:type IV pilus biogenesis/stability protein PilW [Xanthomonadaceae bacterium]
MRLRDAGALSGAFLVLCTFAGCSAFHNNNHVIYENKQDNPHFKSDVNTPHAISQNEVALAEEYIKMGKYDLALDRLQKAVKAEPSSPDPYTMLGLLNERLNRPEQAEANYAKAVKLAPDKGDYLNNYGAWLCRSGHPAEADADFRKALADPFYKTPSEAMENAALCAMKAGKPGVAEAYSQQILAVDPNNTGALQTMADVLYRRGDYMNARGFIERYMTAASKPDPEALDLAARIEDKLGDHDGARDYRNRLGGEFPQYRPTQN